MKLFLAENRGVTEIDWLKSYHSFSFADYYDPSNKGWGNLRVINEDYVSLGAGFEPRFHRDMEIVTLNDRKNKLKLIASLDGREDSLVIKQDLEIYVSELDEAKTISYQMKREKAWIQLFSGSLNVNGEKLKPGDGLAVSEKQELKIESLDSKTHFLLFDVSG